MCVNCCDIDHEDAICVLNYSYDRLQWIFRGFENLNLCKPMDFGRRNRAPPPYWSKDGNGGK